MKKTIISIAVLLALGISQIGFAQNAKEEIVRINKQNQNAFTASYDVDKDVLETAVSDYFSKINLGRSKSYKGYNRYEEAVWSEISPDKIDLYSKVDGRNNTSNLTLLVSKGYDNYVTTMSDEEMAIRIKTFLNNFMQYTYEAQNDADIKLSEEALKKAEKDFDKIVKDGENLVKDKEKIEKEIEKNAAEKEEAAKKVEEEKAKLEALKKKQ